MILVEAAVYGVLKPGGAGLLLLLLLREVWQLMALEVDLEMIGATFWDKEYSARAGPTRDDGTIGRKHGNIAAAEIPRPTDLPFVANREGGGGLRDVTAERLARSRSRCGRGLRSSLARVGYLAESGWQHHG